ncbi:hypothetical protein [Streptacidiphilus sp. MAP5-3]|uniref:hypothetical protein n=1 Tax=unclassified Streptacidiphilus TaxID=2643834 RepID=UPI0035113190
MAPTRNPRICNTTAALSWGVVSGLGFAAALLYEQTGAQAAEKRVYPQGVLYLTSVPLGEQIAGTLVLAMAGVALGIVVLLLRRRCSPRVRRAAVLVIMVPAAATIPLCFSNFSTPHGSPLFALLLAAGFLSGAYGLGVQLIKPLDLAPGAVNALGLALTPGSSASPLAQTHQQLALHMLALAPRVSYRARISEAPLPFSHAVWLGHLYGYVYSGTFNPVMGMGLRESSVIGYELVFTRDDRPDARRRAEWMRSPAADPAYPPPVAWHHNGGFGFCPPGWDPNARLIITHEVAASLHNSDDQLIRTLNLPRSAEKRRSVPSPLP